MSELIKCQCPICGTTHVPTEDDARCTVVAEELSRLTAEYAELKEVHENTVIGNFLDKDGKWEPMHEHYRQQRAEITRLTAELAKVKQVEKICRDTLVGCDCGRAEHFFKQLKEAADGKA